MIRRDSGVTCRRVRELLPRYVDQDLPARDAARVAGHLEGCPACRRRLEVHRTLLEALPDLPEAPLAPEVEARLRRRVREGVEVERRRRARWGTLERLGNAAGWLAATAVALLLVVGLILSGRPLIAARWAAAHPTATATEAPLAMARYESAGLGFAVDYPAAWTVRGSEVSANAPGWHDLGGVEFVSDRYAFDQQAYGPYVLGVTVYDAEGQTVADAVAAWLAPMDAGYLARVEQQPTTLAGEPAVELTGLPGYRWGSREVWAVHGGRLYIVSMTPAREDLVDDTARAAWAACLDSWRFVQVGETPVPPTSPTPAPTPTGAPAATPTEPVPPTPGPAPSPPTAPSPTPAVELPPYAQPVSSLVVMPGQPPLLYAVVDGALYRSADRGQTWAAESRSGLAEAAQLSAVAIDYRHPQTMYALTSGGIYRRQGAGKWALVSDLKATALAVDMADPSVLWAGVERSQAGEAVIVRSADGGRTWAPAGPQVEVSPWGSWASDILVDPNDPNTLWAVVRSNQRDLAPTGQLFRGTRDGAWQRLRLGAYEPAPGNVDGVVATGIAYDPNANLLYVGSERTSDNAGRVLLIRSPDADTAAAGAVRWEVAKYFALPAEPCYMPGLARPLAVDAETPRALYLASDIVACGDESPLDRYRLLASHDDGITWDTLQLDGLP